MNSLNNTNIVVIDHRKLLRRAKALFRKNRLHEAISILMKLKHHGFENDGVNLLIARSYDKLAYLTSEAEYEDTALEKYEEIIRYTGSRRYRRNAIKLRNSFSRRISSLSDSEKKACSRAAEMKTNVPASPKAWFMLGANFPVRKDPMFVINAYKNAVRLNENYILAMFRIAYLYQYYLQDIETAKSFYLRMIKIPPYEDTVEPKSLNIKTILEGCNELSDIYFQSGEMNKVISVFNHSLNIFKTYSDISSLHDIKRITKNSFHASLSLDNLTSLKKHILECFCIDLDIVLNEFGIN